MVIIKLSDCNKIHLVHIGHPNQAYVLLQPNINVRLKMSRIPFIRRCCLTC